VQSFDDEVAHSDGHADLRLLMVGRKVLIAADSICAARKKQTCIRRRETRL
jgi:hypothetical protein